MTPPSDELPNAADTYIILPPHNPIVQVLLLLGVWDARLMAHSKTENPVKKATNSSDGKGKRKLEESHNVSPSKRHKSSRLGLKASAKKVDIYDLDTSESKSTMQYMIGAECTKPIQPDLSRRKRRKERSVQSNSTSVDPSLPIAKTTTPLLAITNGRVGHSDVHIDDDDFVETPPRWHSPTFHSNSPIRKGQSTDASTWHMPQSTGPQSNDAIHIGKTGELKAEQSVSTYSREVQARVDSVISDIVKDTKSETKEDSPVTAPSSGLPVKRAPRLAKAPQSSYVVAEGKQIERSGHVVLFEHYN
ncbi:Hypothetical predicted protein [Olea europaea subsp. europaea]|uniref:Uncharacterized protein n=1 Tax=Olea europaea subsp. europaea TaxID=158383 RepID=A0A8S0RKN4_OLEEU|nr:Hypothetical predicted protein [Olea europaea subsp. europaea]